MNAFFYNGQIGYWRVAEDNSACLLVSFGPFISCPVQYVPEYIQAAIYNSIY